MTTLGLNCPTLTFTNPSVLDDLSTLGYYAFDVDDGLNSFPLEWQDVPGNKIRGLVDNGAAFTLVNDRRLLLWVDPNSKPCKLGGAVGGATIISYEQGTVGFFVDLGDQGGEVLILMWGMLDVNAPKNLICEQQFADNHPGCMFTLSNAERRVTFTDGTFIPMERSGNHGFSCGG